MDVPLLTTDDVAARIDRVDAVRAIDAALRDGWDIESDPPRLFSPLTAGEFLLMPAESPEHAGLKAVTVAPGNPARGLPKIQAWYLLFDAATLQPSAILDGTLLTVLRTPAVTAVAVREMLAADARGARTRIDTLVVFGSGPQAEAHVRTLADILPVGRVIVVGRNDERARALVDRLVGFDAVVGSAADAREADVVITATSASEPVIGAGDVAPNAVVAAIGAHGLDHRELGTDLVLGADVVVEARASALRENGDVLLAKPADWWASAPEATLTNLAELVAGRFTRTPDRPAVYSGVGMSWEDLAVAEWIMRSERGAAAAR